MSNEVQFDFDEEQRPEYNRSGSKLSRLVVRWSGGRVDEAQANYVLFGVTVVAIIFSLFLFTSGVNDGYSQEGLPSTQFVPGKISS